MRANAERVSQILAERLLEELDDGGDSGQLVAFSDSRQGAATLSAEVDTSHYRDTVRQLVVRSLTGRSEAAARLRAFMEEIDRPREERDSALIQQVRSTSAAAQAVIAARGEFATDEERTSAEEARGVRAGGLRQLAEGARLRVRRAAGGRSKPSRSGG